MAFNLKLVVRDDYQEDIIDLIQVSSSISMGAINNDVELVKGNKMQAGVLGIGSINVGRTVSFGIPIFERKQNGQWVKIEDQYIKYTSSIMSVSVKKYFLRISYNNEIYEAEYSLVKVDGYNITYVKNMGVVSIDLRAIDKVFLRQNKEIFALPLDILAKNKQDIYYTSNSHVPVPLYFYLEFELKSDYLSFTFANRKNFGIYCSANIQNTNKALCYFNGIILSINGVGYNFKGIAPELEIGQNVLYLEYNQTLINANLEYRRGILI